jgi:hypothetical protein
MLSVPSPQEIREKGAGPAIALYLKRNHEVRAWDGRESVEAGDSLRLEIAPAGYDYVVVATPGAEASAPSGAPLYAGAIDPAHPTLLPVSWRVDDSPSPEVLEVTLTRAGSTPWRTRLVLPKTSHPRI